MANTRGKGALGNLASSSSVARGLHQQATFNAICSYIIGCDGCGDVGLGPLHQIAHVATTTCDIEMQLVFCGPVLMWPFTRALHKVLLACQQKACLQSSKPID
jgi:hypothetical protein